MKNIPVVDLRGLAEQDWPSWERISKELDSAFASVGFVYLTNHGINQKMVDRVIDVSRRFFQLPGGDKDQVRRALDKNDGYVGINQEIFDSSKGHEIREAYNCTSPNGLYPDEVLPEFKGAVNELATALCQLTRFLLECIALALGLSKDHFTQLHRFMFNGAEKNVTTFRSLYYPSIADNDVHAGTVRCGEHSDYGTITLLLQDDIGGLEVLSANEWIHADPIPGTILVNLGDLMQFWTADRYRATMHRVRVPEEEIRRRSARQSLAFFVHPDNDVIVSPLDGTDKHPPVGALDHLKARLSATYKF